MTSSHINKYLRITILFFNIKIAYNSSNITAITDTINPKISKSKFQSDSYKYFTHKFTHYPSTDEYELLGVLNKIRSPTETKLSMALFETNEQPKNEEIVNNKPEIYGIGSKLLQCPRISQKQVSYFHFNTKNTKSAINSKSIENDNNENNSNNDTKFKENFTVVMEIIDDKLQLNIKLYNSNKDYFIEESLTIDKSNLFSSPYLYTERYNILNNKSDVISFEFNCNIKVKFKDILNIFRTLKKNKDSSELNKNIDTSCYETHITKHSSKIMSSINNSFNFNIIKPKNRNIKQHNSSIDEFNKRLDFQNAIKNKQSSGKLAFVLSLNENCNNGNNKDSEYINYNLDNSVIDESNLDKSSILTVEDETIKDDKSNGLLSSSEFDIVENIEERKDNKVPKIKIISNSNYIAGNTEWLNKTEKKKFKSTYIKKDKKNRIDVPIAKQPLYIKSDAEKQIQQYNSDVSFGTEHKSYDNNVNYSDLYDMNINDKEKNKNKDNTKDNNKVRNIILTVCFSMCLFIGGCFIIRYFALNNISTNDENEVESESNEVENNP